MASASLRRASHLGACNSIAVGHVLHHADSSWRSIGFSALRRANRSAAAFAGGLAQGFGMVPEADRRDVVSFDYACQRRTR
jgi:hypothetical protein